MAAFSSCSTTYIGPIRLVESLRFRAEQYCKRSKSLFESALSRTYANSAVSALSLEQALACKTGCPLLARSLWARFRQPRRQGFLGQAIEIPHSNSLLERRACWKRRCRGTWKLPLFLVVGLVCRVERAYHPYRLVTPDHHRSDPAFPPRSQLPVRAERSSRQWPAG